MTRNQTHPRLFFTVGQIETLRAKSVDPEPNPFTGSFAACWQAIEDEARGYLNETRFACTYYGGKRVVYPVPPRQPEPFPDPPGFATARYPYWTGMSSAIQVRMLALSLAYAVTGIPEYGEKVRSYALALADWDTWSDPTYNCSGKTCLDTGYLTQGVAVAYDLAHDLMAEAERAKLRAALIRLGLRNLYADTVRKVDHNIHMVRTSALGLGGLAVWGETAEAEAFVARAVDNFSWFLDRRLSSRSTEGMLYTNVSLDYILRFGDALKRVTGQDAIFAHPYVREYLPRWLVYFLAPGGKGLVPFSDARTDNYFGGSMSILARNNGDALAAWYLQESGAARTAITGFLNLDRETPVKGPAESGFPPSALFDDIGWVALRSGWGADDALLAFQSSLSAMGHNHFDQNHFVLNVAGEWLITDPGYQDYGGGPRAEVTVQTIGHNALLVDGQGQNVRGHGEITGFAASPVYDYAAGDAGRTYALTERWVRQVMYAKPDYFLILDDVRLKGPAGTELLVHTDRAATLAVEGAEFRIRKEHAQVRGAVLLPASATLRKDVVKGAEDFGPFVRIDSGVRSEHNRFLWLLQPSVLADGEPSPLPVSQVAVSEGMIACQVSGSGWHDRWLLRVSSGEPAALDGQPLTTDGNQAFVRYGPDGKVQRYALVAGSRLTHGRTALVEASAAVTVALGETAGDWSGTLVADEEVEVILALPPGARLVMDGKAEGAAAGEDRVRIRAGQGVHTLEVR